MKGGELEEKRVKEIVSLQDNTFHSGRTTSCERSGLRSSRTKGVKVKRLTSSEDNE